MEILISINGTPEEIAALVVEIQKRHNYPVCNIADIKEVTVDTLTELIRKGKLS